MSDATQILSELEEGDHSSAEKLLLLVYDELRKLAAARLAKENPGHTLQPTALVHDAYVRLVDVKKAQHWKSQGHFFAAAAEAMRRILVESARRKATAKRGGELARVELSDAVQGQSGDTVDILALDEALAQLAAEHPRKAELVKLRYFAGMTQKEAAKTLEIALRTADTDWAYARAYLQVEIENND